MYEVTFDLTLDELSAPSILPPLCPPCPPSLSSLSWSQAKVNNEIIDYRDLAAIPRVKAIYEVEHPDMICYEDVNNNSSTLDNKDNRQESQSTAKVTLFQCSRVVFSHR